MIAGSVTAQTGSGDSRPASMPGGASAGGGAELERLEVRLIEAVGTAAQFVGGNVDAKSFDHAGTILLGDVATSAGLAEPEGFMQEVRASRMGLFWERRDWMLLKRQRSGAGRMAIFSTSPVRRRP